MALPLSHQAGHLRCQLGVKSCRHLFWLLNAVKSGVDDSHAWLHIEIIWVFIKNTGAWVPFLSKLILLLNNQQSVFVKWFITGDSSAVHLGPDFEYPSPTEKLRWPATECWPPSSLSQTLCQFLGYGLSSQAYCILSRRRNQGKPRIMQIKSWDPKSPQKAGWIDRPSIAKWDSVGKVITSYSEGKIQVLELSKEQALLK